MSPSSTSDMLVAPVSGVRGFVRTNGSEESQRSSDDNGHLNAEKNRHRRSVAVTSPHQLLRSASNFLGGLWDQAAQGLKHPFDACLGLRSKHTLTVCSERVGLLQVRQTVSQGISLSHQNKLKVKNQRTRYDKCESSD
jgi:hypothetical protein